MPRIACLLVADFPLAALLRADPELRGRPVAVSESAEPRAPLVAVSPQAASAGIRAGQTIAEARALHAALVVRRIHTEVASAASAALLDVADSFSPRVECAAPGVAFLDLDGLAALFGDERYLAVSLRARIRRIGLDARVGIASTKAAALLAAEHEDGVSIIPAGLEQERLAPLPVGLLLGAGPFVAIRRVDAPRDVAATLARWGIRTLGDLARLPAAGVGDRLGEAAVALRRAARGEDDEPLSPRARPLRFEESLDAEYGIESFEPLSFLLRAALERLVARLEVRGHRAGDLALSLRLENGAREERTVRVAAPTNEVKVLLALVRTSFEKRPPAGAVSAFRLAAVAERLRAIELGLFVPSGPAPAELDATITRLAAITGPGRIGCAAVVDSHRPEAFTTESFVLRPTPLPLAAQSDSELSPLALRAYRPPAPLHVVCDRGRPDFVQTAAGAPATPPIHGRVVTLAGPWRVQGEWWREPPLARDYYDAELSDGCVYRIYRDQRERWFADGVYD